jgi:anti-sigma B factor antagonist
MFEIQVVEDGRVTLKGRLDAAESDRALAVLRRLDRPLTVDFSGLDYISSAGIGVLIETYKRLTASGHTLKLVNLLPRVRNVFAYAGLDRILTIE